MIPTTCEFTNEGVTLRTCEITPEVIRAFDFAQVTTETPAKPCYCDSKETYDELIHDADSIGWNIPEGTVVPEKPAAKVSRRKKNA